MLCAAILLVLGSPACAVSPWVVFFAPGSARLTPQALAIIDSAAAAYPGSGIRGFDVYGHTDRVGSPESNLRLARRRAEAVKAALVWRGIPADALALDAMGEEAPLVETEDGGAEPQNRRVEIVITCIENPAPGFGYMRCG